MKRSIVLVVALFVFCMLFASCNVNVGGSDVDQDIAWLPSIELILSTDEKTLHTFQDGIAYNIYEIQGRGEVAAVNQIEKKDGKVVLPEFVTINNRTYDVIAIRPGACSAIENNLEDLTINARMETIAAGVFAHCKSLCNLKYCGTVSSWCKIEFKDADANPLKRWGTLYGSDGREPLLTEKNIEDAAKSGTFNEIGDYAFVGLRTERITVPTPVKKIGKYAFSGCIGLTSITLPDSITTIGENAFAGCPIEMATIPAQAISSIPKEKLKTVVVTGGDSIEDNAFSGCGNLTSVTISDSITTIGENAFAGCPIETATIPAMACPFVKGDKLRTLIITSGEKIEKEMLSNCDNLMSVTIPASAKSVVLAEDDSFVELPPKLVHIVNHSEVNITVIDLFYNADTNGAWEKFRNEARDAHMTPKEYLEATFRRVSGYYVEIKDELNDQESFLKAYINLGMELSFGISENVYEIVKDEIEFKNALATDEYGVTTYKVGDSNYFLGYTGDEKELDLRGYDINAFFPCAIVGNKITNVTIGNSVTSVGCSAFRNCTGLTSITIPDSVTSIGDRAFYGCSSLTSITIPDSVTSIGDYAFDGCSRLTSVTIGNGVTSIGDYAFYDCSGLVSVYYTGDIASWCGIKFDYYSANNPLSYAHNLYINNELVTEIIIPAGVTSIGNYAFYNCSGLKSVIIPDSVTSIGSDAFYNCPIETATIPAIACASIKNSALETVIITSGTSIGDDAFENCSGLTSITIPDSVTSIGSSAFRDCSNLQYNEYDNGYYLGNNTHPYFVFVKVKNKNITSIDIADTTKIIYLSAFSGCSGLTSITIPDSVTSIGEQAFYNCSRLTKVYYTGDIASWCGIAFGDYDANPLSYAHNLYINNELFTEIEIPDMVTKINDYAFYGCTGFTSITIPDSVKSIGGSAFYGCSGLTSINIPDSVTSIGDLAFYNCTGLTSITIPDSVTGIGYYAFYGCSGLTSVTIGNGVTSIGYGAFYGCYELVEVYNKSSLNIRKGSSDYGYVGYYAKNIYPQ